MLLNGLGPKFKEVLEITRLSTIFNIEDRPLSNLPKIDIVGGDVSVIKLAHGLPLLLTLRENRIHLDLGIRDGVYKVRSDGTPRGSNTIIASPYAVAAATHTLLSDDVKAFEDLINSARTHEEDIHRFIETHPNLLLSSEYTELRSKVLLEREGEGPLIPDFMLQPVDTELCDLLDLKLPISPVVVGTRNRRRFSSAVHEAVAQLRMYRDYFEDKTRREAILSRYNIKAYRPRMTVIIGRATSMDPIEYRQIAEGQRDVKVMTYDDLLARAKRFLIV